MSEMYRQAIEAQSRPGAQHPYLPFPWPGERVRRVMEVARFPNSLHKRGGEPDYNRSGKYQLTSCAAGARSGNGLPGHPSSQAGGGQPIQSHHQSNPIQVVNQSRLVMGLSIPAQLQAIRGAPESLIQQVHYYISRNGKPKRKCWQSS